MQEYTIKDYNDNSIIATIRFETDINATRELWQKAKEYINQMREENPKIYDSMFDIEIIEEYLQKNKINYSINYVEEDYILWL